MIHMSHRDVSLQPISSNISASMMLPLLTILVEWLCQLQIVTVYPLYMRVSINGDLQNGWFRMEFSVKIDDFRKPP